MCGDGARTAPSCSRMLSSPSQYTAFRETCPLRWLCRDGAARVPVSGPLLRPGKRRCKLGCMNGEERVDWWSWKSVGITYSIRTPVWCIGIETQKPWRKHKILMEPQLSWDNEEGKNLTNTKSASSPPNILRPLNLWFPERPRFIETSFSSRIFGLFSQTSWDQYFHWLKALFHYWHGPPRRHVGVRSVFGDLPYIWYDREWREMLLVMRIGAIDVRMREICMLCGKGIILEQHACVASEPVYLHESFGI